MAPLQLEEFELLHQNICQAFADPKRLLILYALYQQPRHVTALADDLGFPQPTVSRHLRVLRERSLVSSERDGAAVIYRVTDERIIEVINLMRGVLRDRLQGQVDMIPLEKENQQVA
jgi:ArsR family transcriptional regulator